MQMANGLSFSLLGFLVRGFSDRRTCLLAIVFSSAAFSGLRNAATSARILPPRPKLTAQPAAPRLQAVQPTPSQPAKKSRCAREITTNRRSFVVWGGNIKGSRRPAEQCLIKRQLTAAHPSLPFGSKIKVTNLANGKSVEVEITDRGPVAENRIIDLSQAAAKALEMIGSGTATVRLELPSGQ